LDEPTQIDLLLLWRVLWSHRYLILVLMIIGGGIATYLALTATPKFRAEVVVTEVREGGMSAAAGLVSQLGGLASLAGLGVNTGGGQEATAVLNSRRLVEEFITRNQLMPVLFPDESKRPTLWAGVQQFQSESLDIREDARKGVTTVAIEWTNPATAAKWANAYVALTNELVRGRALEESKRNISYLNEQIARTNVVELRKVMYNLIENETKTLMLANGRSEYAFTVVDPAVPPEIRTSPKRTVMVMLGLALGLVFGVIASFVHHLFARSREQRAAVAA
jgi:uncharacterized protein involved in exopolysaccharide biosynthesis